MPFLVLLLCKAAMLRRLETVSGRTSDSTAIVRYPSDRKLDERSEARLLGWLPAWHASS
jgi:hypothetical protein